MYITGFDRDRVDQYDLNDAAVSEFSLWSLLFLGAVGAYVLQRQNLLPFSRPKTPSAS